MSLTQNGDFSPGEGQPGIISVTLAPFYIALDWLTLNMRGPLRLLEYTEPVPWRGKDGRAYVWQRQPTAPTPWGARYILFDEHGNKIFTVLGFNTSPIMRDKPKDWMSVQFANEILHNGQFANFYGQLLEMGFVYMSISRLDIASDGLRGDGGDFQKPIQATWGGTWDYYGKSNWRPNFSRKKVTQAELGTRSSNKYLRVYCKSKELKRPYNVAKRAYMLDIWSGALGRDLTESDEVNRLEIQVKGKEVRRYVPAEGERDYPFELAKATHLVDLFSSMVPSVFDFRYKERYARDTEPLTWDWSHIHARPMQYERRKNSIAISQHSLKNTIKNLWLLAHTAGSKHLLHDAQEIAFSAGLMQWYADAQERWYIYHSKLDHTNDQFTRMMQGRLIGRELFRNERDDPDREPWGQNVKL